VNRALRPALVALVAAVACCLTACDSAKDAAQSTASKAADKAQSEASAAASKAASEATDAAKKQAKDAATHQVCDLVTGSGPLADGTVSTSDRTIAKAVAAAAEKAGVEDQYLKPLQTLADSASTDFSTRAALTQLKKVCG
jgi:hypothetical protein